MLACLIALSSFNVTSAWAQIYPPDDAKRVFAILNGSDKVVVIRPLLRILQGKKTYTMNPAIQIRDPDNRIILPAYARGKYKARMVLDINGQVLRLWLVEQENS